MSVADPHSLVERTKCTTAVNAVWVVKGGGILEVNVFI